MKLFREAVRRPTYIETDNTKKKGERKTWEIGISAAYAAHV